MNAQRIFLLCFVVASGLLQAEEARRVQFSGFLRSRSSSPVGPAEGRDWEYKIMELAPEGKRVAKGELVAKFESTHLKQWEQDANVDYLEQKVNGESKIAKLVEQVKTLEDTVANDRKSLETLQVGAGESESARWNRPGRDILIEKLDIESRQIKLQKVEEKLDRKRKLLEASEKLVGQRIKTEEIELQRLRDEVKPAEILADRAGVIVYKLGWRREKPKTGGTVHRGSTVIEIVDDRDLYVEGFMQEEFWSQVAVGQIVDVRITGRNEMRVGGKIKSISPVVMRVSDWDRSLPDSHFLSGLRTFRVDIELDSVPEEAKPNGEVVIGAGS